MGTTKMSPALHARLCAVLECLGLEGNPEAFEGDEDGSWELVACTECLEHVLYFTRDEEDAVMWADNLDDEEGCSSHVVHDLAPGQGPLEAATLILRELSDDVTDEAPVSVEATKAAAAFTKAGHRVILVTTPVETLAKALDHLILHEEEPPGTRLRESRLGAILDASGIGGASVGALVAEGHLVDTGASWAGDPILFLSDRTRGLVQDLGSLRAASRIRMWGEESDDGSGAVLVDAPAQVPAWVALDEPPPKTVYGIDHGTRPPSVSVVPVDLLRNQAPAGGQDGEE